MADFGLLVVILETNNKEHTKFIRFKGLFWHIVRFSISTGSKVMDQNIEKVA